MEKIGNNYYQTCRLLANLTQEKASEKLHISNSMLAKIETGASKAGDETVCRMAEVYNAPLLVWWHLKTHSPFSDYLPDVQEPKSTGDMALQSILMEDALQQANSIIKKLLADGKITPDEFEAFAQYQALIKVATSRGASIGIYAGGEVGK